jgi:hypothetical protein
MTEPNRPVWRPLCLSHDPALIVDPDSGGYLDLEPLLDELDPHGAGIHVMHPGCDLMVGSFAHLPGSGERETLLSVVCPPHRIELHPGTHQHEEAVHVEAVWLGLLAALRPARNLMIPDGDPLAAAARRLPECWTNDRARRLAPLLGVTVPRG